MPELISHLLPQQLRPVGEYTGYIRVFRTKHLLLDDLRPLVERFSFSVPALECGEYRGSVGFKLVALLHILHSKGLVVVRKGVQQ